MQTPLLSIVVITYNQEQYISKTLESLVTQKHEYPYEILIGEDCSNDNTKQIIEEFVVNYPSIIKPIYNKKNMGLISNYFNTIAKCQGKYIMECAGDDWWLPGKISKQIKFMELHEDIGLSFGKAKIWDENNQCYKQEVLGKKRETFEELIDNNDVPAVTVCIRNSVLKEYIKSINPQNKKWYMEDYPIWLFFSRESKIAFINDELAVYRLHDNSITHSINLEKQISFEKNVYEIKNFYLQRYNFPSIEFNEDKIKNSLLFNALLNCYNKEDAKKLINRLLHSPSFYNLIKAFLISNSFFVKFARLFFL